MKTIYEMSAKELKGVAREHNMPGAWKATKSQMIEFLEGIGYEPETTEEPEEVTVYEPEAVEAEPETTEEPEAETIETVEAEEATAYEVDNPESDETTANEVDNEIEEETTETEDGDEEETAKTVKRPSLGINAIEFNGKAQTLRAWAEELNMPWPTLYDRINRNGWTIEEALTIPLGGRRKRNKKEEA